MDSYIIGQYEYPAFGPPNSYYLINDTNLILGSPLYIHEGFHPQFLINFNSTSTSPTYSVIAHVINVNDLDSSNVIMKHWPINSRFYNLNMERYKLYYWGYPSYFQNDLHNGDTLVVYYDRVNFAGVFLKSDLIIRDSCFNTYIGNNIPKRDSIYDFFNELLN